MAAGHPGDELLAEAERAQDLSAGRIATAGAELARPPLLGIDDETRARAAILMAGAVRSAEAGLRAADPALESADGRALPERFAAAGLLARSGLAAAALLRAEEHRLAAALVRVAAPEEAQGAQRLDPIGGDHAAESFAVRAAEAARMERTGDPLLPIHDIAAEDRHALFWQVAACLVSTMPADPAGDEALHRMAAAAVARALAAIDDAEGIAPAAMALARRLGESHRIDDGLLAGTLASGRVASLAALLATRAGIGFDPARAMLTDAARAAVLLRACGVERGVAVTMILALSLALDRGFGPDPTHRAADIVGGFDALPVERARAEVRRARLEPSYAQALAALAAIR